MAIRPGSKVKRKKAADAVVEGQPADAVEPARKLPGNPHKAAAVANLGGATNMYRQAAIGPHGMTPKQMKFFEGLISGKNLSDAYRDAYDTSNMNSNSIGVAAHHLRKNAKIQAALMEWRHQCGLQMKFTTETLSAMAVEAYETAFEAGNAGQMTGALAQLAKLNGLIVERSERKVEQVGEGKNRAAMVAELRKLTGALGITIIDSTATEVQPENMGGHIDGDVQGE